MMGDTGTRLNSAWVLAGRRPAAYVLELDREAMQRRRHGVPDEGVVLAAEPPSEPPHQVVHGRQRLHPGELDPGAQPLPAAERHERVGRRLALEPRRVELVRVPEDAGVHVRHARRPEHLPPLGDDVAVDLDVLQGSPEAAEDGRDHPQRFQGHAPREPHAVQVLPRQRLAVGLVPGDLFVLCASPRGLKGVVSSGSGMARQR